MNCFGNACGAILKQNTNSVDKIKNRIHIYKSNAEFIGLDIRFACSFALGVFWGMAG